MVSSIIYISEFNIVFFSRLRRKQELIKDFKILFPYLQVLEKDIIFCIVKMEKL